MIDPIDRLLEQIYAYGLCHDAGTDNATTHPAELEALQGRITANCDLSYVVLPIGNGQMIVTRSRETGSREVIDTESISQHAKG